MIKVYGAHRSRASRVYWLVNELGIAVEEVPVRPAQHLPDPMAPGAPLNTRSPEFVRLSPAGAVPAIDDDGFLLTESLVITLYLARKFGGPLGPRNAQEDALMQQWSFYAATWIEPHAVAILSAGAPDAKAEVKARAAPAAEALRRPLKLLEGHFQAEGYLVGGRFTVADLNMAEVLRYAQGHPTLIGEFPAVDAWLKTCHARPAFKAMWARRMAEPA